jgi:hypothetical protein
VTLGERKKNKKNKNKTNRLYGGEHPPFRCEVKVKKM